MLSKTSGAAGFILLEVVSLTLVAALVMLVALEAYMVARAVIQRELAQWQVHHRLSMASSLMEKELRMAGYRGGWFPLAETFALPAIQGGYGRIDCTAPPCVTAQGDHFEPSGQDRGVHGITPWQSTHTAAPQGGTIKGHRDAILLRYWRTRGDAYAYHLPLVEEQKGERTTTEAHFNYVTGFYIEKSPSGQYGLYQRTSGQRYGQEMVTGVNGLKCEFLERLSEGHLSEHFVSANHIRHWYRVVGVQCQLSAESDPHYLRSGLPYKASGTRMFSVALRNMDFRIRGEQRFQQWMAGASP
ncbi:hypothetical protein [Cernens ardua]|uniref:hypothetical protein n=1 Tax=Cernens ardua TaxID=3402176 RepID=UPI003F9992E1